MDEPTTGFEDLDVGRSWESAERLVTHDDVVAFAHLTGDLNPIHTDPEFARKTPYRRPVAHGLLGVGIAAGLMEASSKVRMLAFLTIRRWEFLLPIFPGDRIRTVTTVLSKEPRGRGRRGAVVWGMAVLNQDGHAVQRSETVTLVGASQRPGEAGRSLADGAGRAAGAEA